MSLRQHITATLNWFIDNSYNFSTLTAFDQSLDNLDLEIWKIGVTDTLIAQSMSTYNNVEHLSFLLPEAGDYRIRVKWTGEVFDLVGDANVEQYAVSWSVMAVPEPASPVAIALALMFTLGRSRRRNGSDRRAG